MDTNAFTAMAMATKPAKAARAPTPVPRATKLPDGSGSFVMTIGAPAKRKAPTPAHAKVNPNTAVSGVPRAAKVHAEKQLDGNRTQQFSKPVKKGGLAERGPSAAKATSDRVSGLETAMHAEADRHHPRQRPKVTRR